MKCGITSEQIHSLRPKEIFVFGSNLSGIHGGGAALLAKKWGAYQGRGIGLSGQTYALPTKDQDIRTLGLSDILAHVDDFLHFVWANPTMHFLITKIGCGLAGYEPEDIAPLFGGRFVRLENISLPYDFIQIISEREAA